MIGWGRRWGSERVRGRRGRLSEWGQGGGAVAQEGEADRIERGGGAASGEEAAVIRLGFGRHYICELF